MTPDDVITFWFGLRPEQWWAKDDAFDAALRERFGETHAAAARGDLDDWTDTPRGRLALVILFDQMSRNIYRGQMKAFALDNKARRLANEALTRGEDAKLAPIERYFLLMPLMHAEDGSIQRRCIAEFERLRAESPEDLQKMMENAIDYARKHAAIIERFGRFPHRNAVLKRPSTPAEEAFLKEPGSSF